MRALVLSLLMSTGLLVITTVTPPTASAGARGTVEPDYTFVSMPDTFNNDFGDVSDAAGWTPGSPNSINEAYRAAIATVFDDVAALRPQAALVAGDTVEGHWGMDTAGTGIFGPVSTTTEKRAAVRRAAEQYYAEYRDLWASRGIPLHAAVGDHEIGDNPWRADRGGYTAFKHANVGLFKREWARFFTEGGTRFDRRPTGTPFEDTTYAAQLAPEVLLVTLDVFRRTRSNVVADIGRAQLSWLRGELRRARATGIDWVIVQGHTPIVGPVRQQSSSGLMYRGGTGSRLWRTLQRFDVDFYLAGEVHANTVTYRGRSPVQIAHGGLFRRGDATALEGRVFGRRMELRLLGWRSALVAQPEGQVIWQTDTHKNIEEDVVYESGPTELGTLSITSNGRVLSKTGTFADTYRG